jgi:hypothetical protein
MPRSRLPAQFWHPTGAFRDLPDAVSGESPRRELRSGVAVTVCEGGQSTGSIRPSWTILAALGGPERRGPVSGTSQSSAGGSGVATLGERARWQAGGIDRDNARHLAGGVVVCRLR